MSIAARVGDTPDDSYWERQLFRLIEQLCHEPVEVQERCSAALPPRVQLFLLQFWQRWAHKGQIPDDGDWRVWLIMAGRGFGKTRAGAEWVSEVARSDGHARIALVGATAEDVHKVMITGQSGLQAVARQGERLQYLPSHGLLRFASGAMAHVYSAECFEKLRGPEHSHAWCDELGKWNNADGCWDNLMLGLRLGERQRVLVTTTPRQMRLLHRLKKEDGVVVCGGGTARNHNLPDDFVMTVKALYEGTRWGRQELDGELIEDVEGALWSRDLIERQRVTILPELKRIVIGVDPPVSDHGDACGIVAVGSGADGKAYVLADHSVSGASPEQWARAVAGAVEAWGADRVVAEDNQGGNMVESTLRAADLAMPVKRVHASRGKSARAEPVAALYEAGRAFHVGAFSELEDQMCGLISGGGYDGPGRSPDRADALVWAMTELMLGKAAKVPRVSVL
jgi:phage terminase large subunit-like protein